jgi:hypothetical protein
LGLDFGRKLQQLAGLSEQDPRLGRERHLDAQLLEDEPGSVAAPAGGHGVAPELEQGKQERHI